MGNNAYPNQITNPNAAAPIWGNPNLVVSVTPVVAASANASGNALSTIMTFPVFKTTLRASGLLTNFWVMSKTGLTGAMTIYVFGTKPATLPVKNTAWLLNVADMPLLVTPPFVLTPAVIGVGAVESVGSNQNIGSIVNSDSPLTANVYIVAVTAGVTPAS